MTTMTPLAPPTEDRFPSARTGRALQPLFVAVVIAIVSYLTVTNLARVVLLTGGSPLIIVIALPAAAAVLAIALGFGLRWLRARSPWLTATVLTLVALGVYIALIFTGTQRFSIVMLRPELQITAVALATGAALAIIFPGWWRALGIAGVVALISLALTPVLVAL